MGRGVLRTGISYFHNKLLCKKLKSYAEQKYPAPHPLLKTHGTWPLFVLSPVNSVLNFLGV